MSFLIGVLVLVVGLMVSIALHEIGHLVPAKKFGVYVPQYFVGFGPTLWSTKRGETEYGVKAILLGGYVRLAGMFPPARPGTPTHRKDGTPTTVELARQDSAAELPADQAHRAFYRLSTGRKIVVMLGGPIMNLIISAVLLTVVISGLGVAQLTTTLNQVMPCTTDSQQCAPEDQAPGAAAGLQQGDEIIQWGPTPATDWPTVQQAIAEGGTQPTDVVIERDGQRQTVSVTPQLAERPVEGGGTEERPYVGISPQVRTEPRPISEVPGMVWAQARGTAEVLVRLPVTLVEITGSLFGTQERNQDVVGLVGVGRFAGEITSADVENYTFQDRATDLLSLLAALNMTLFLFNLVPLLPLDGGHIAGALWEGGRRAWAKARGKPDPGFADTARLLPLTYVVVGFMLVMTVILVAADFISPVSLFNR